MLKADPFQVVVPGTSETVNCPFTGTFSSIPKIFFGVYKVEAQNVAFSTMDWDFWISSLTTTNLQIHFQRAVSTFALIKITAMATDQSLSYIYAGNSINFAGDCKGYWKCRYSNQHWIRSKSNKLRRGLLCCYWPKYESCKRHQSINLLARRRHDNDRLVRVQGQHCFCRFNSLQNCLNSRLSNYYAIVSILLLHLWQNQRWTLTAILVTFGVLEFSHWLDATKNHSSRQHSI